VEVIYGESAFRTRHSRHAVRRELFRWQHRRQPGPGKNNQAERENYIIDARAALTFAAIAKPVPISMTDPNDLKNIGLKATLPRLKILDLFRKLEEEGASRHVTAEDVYRHLLADGIDIGLATVYRVLTQFEQAGLLQRHHFESGKAIFELNEGHHHDHLVCLQCGRVEEFVDPGIEKRQTEIAESRGFSLHEHALYLYVDCTKTDCIHRKTPD
jgi:Fur family ferric uptake transcriptional regulator